MEWAAQPQGEYIYTYEGEEVVNRHVPVPKISVFAVCFFSWSTNLDKQLTNRWVYKKVRKEEVINFRPTGGGGVWRSPAVREWH